MRASTRQQIVVPQKLRDELLRSAHDDLLGGHLGRERTYQRLRDKYWWPRLYHDVEEWVKTCESCQAKKDPRHTKGGQLESIPVSRPFERMGMDLIGPLPKTYRGNKYILVMIDYLTKWVEAFALPKDTAEAVAEKFVEEVVCRFGAPEILLTDRGKQFLGKLMSQVNRLLGIRKENTTAYHPQTDGLVERFNHTLVDMLAKYVAGHQKDWDIYIPYVLFAYRVTPQESTGESPFYLMTGRTPITPEDVSMGVKTDAERLPEVIIRLKDARELARRSIEWAQDKQREAYNKRREEREFRTGQLVLVYVPAVKRGRVKKLTSKWRGPYIVIGKRGLNNYLVRAKDNERDIQAIHVERMKPYFDPSQPEGELEVQEILDWRIGVEGKKEYLIKWRAMTDRYNEWISEEDLHAPELLRKFKRHHRESKETRPALRSTTMEKNPVDQNHDGLTPDQHNPPMNHSKMELDFNFDQKGSSSEAERIFSDGEISIQKPTPTPTPPSSSNAENEFSRKNGMQQEIRQEKNDSEPKPKEDTGRLEDDGTPGQEKKQDRDKNNRESIIERLNGTENKKQSESRHQKGKRAALPVRRSARQADPSYFHHGMVAHLEDKLKNKGGRLQQGDFLENRSS